MFVDPEISRHKFEREVAQFLADRKAHHRRGVWLVDATFPEAHVVFVTAHTRPYPMVAFATVINFENYDVEPPSVRFVHSLTGETLKKRELPHQFATKVQRILVGPGQVMEVPEQPLIVGFDDEAPAFLCLQGVREYHNHPAHSGDSWWLHRKSGKGTLSYIVEQLARFGIEPIRGVHIDLQPKIGAFAVQAPQ